MFPYFNELSIKNEWIIDFRKYRQINSNKYLFSR